MNEARLVAMATSYAMIATPEETEAMLRRAYGPDRIPGTEVRRRSQRLGMAWATPCAMQGCDKPALSCGWCREHCWVNHRHCSVEGCDKLVKARGLCGAHYERLRRHGNLPPKSPLPTKAAVRAECREALDRATEETA
jgi:hypothetical protein